jgi:hypothetical protein
MVNYLLTMELNINAYAIVEAANEEEAERKGRDLKFDCNLSPADNYGRIAPVAPFYYGDVDVAVLNVEMYDNVSNIQSFLEEERLQRSQREKDKRNLTN